jgi:hypothetical protein
MKTGISQSQYMYKDLCQKYSKDVLESTILWTTARKGMEKRKNQGINTIYSVFEALVMEAQDCSVKIAADGEPCYEEALRFTLFKQEKIQAAAMKFPVSASTLKRKRKKYYEAFAETFILGEPRQEAKGWWQHDENMMLC